MKKYILITLLLLSYSIGAQTKPTYFFCSKEVVKTCITHRYIVVAKDTVEISGLGNQPSCYGDEKLMGMGNITDINISVKGIYYTINYFKKQ